MPKPKRKSIDIEKILEKNPGVDAKALAEVLKVLEELRNSGVQIKRYNLELPFSKGLQRSRFGSCREEEDPRIVRLGRL
jgi:hypothetical protein